MATLNITPPAHVVQSALDHCNLPLVILDDHTVNVAELTGERLQKLLSAVVNMAMVKHVEDTMIFPSKAARLRELANDLGQFQTATSVDFTDLLDEFRNTLNTLANNLTADRS